MRRSRFDFTGAWQPQYHSRMGGCRLHASGSSRTVDLRPGVAYEMQAGHVTCTLHHTFKELGHQCSKHVLQTTKRTHERRANRIWAFQNGVSRGPNRAEAAFIWTSLSLYSATKSCIQLFEVNNEIPTLLWTGRIAPNHLLQCWLQITPSNASVKTYENAPDPPGGICHETKTKAKQQHLTLVPCGWPPTSNIDSIPPSCSFFLTKYLEQNNIKPGNLLQELWGCSSASCTYCILCSLNVWEFALGGCHRSIVLRLRCQKQVFKFFRISFNWAPQLHMVPLRSLCDALIQSTHGLGVHDNAILMPFCIALVFWYRSSARSSFWHLVNRSCCVFDNRTIESKLARSTLGKLPQAVFRDTRTKEEAIADNADSH